MTFGGTIVIGSRYLEKTSDVPEHRIWGHRLFNWLTTTTTGVSSTDSQSGFRAFSARAIECFAFQSNGFSVESEMQFLVHEHHLKLLEVPITITYQDAAKRNVFHHGLLVLNGVLRLTGQGVDFAPYLARHAQGDWGNDLDSFDRRQNDTAVKEGYRILSAYTVPVGDDETERIWIITEADRSATTILLPSEY